MELVRSGLGSCSSWVNRIHIFASQSITLARPNVDISAAKKRKRKKKKKKKANIGLLYEPVVSSDYSTADTI